ncbi:hypothetical protein C9426_28770 [Serratia sp. S1B]|nr:hypothetical protein C9426_28770 [Serratia sp. S1B]
MSSPLNWRLTPHSSVVFLVECTSSYHIDRQSELISPQRWQLASPKTNALVVSPPWWRTLNGPTACSLMHGEHQSIMSIKFI